MTEIITRGAAVGPRSWNAQERTLEVIFATETPVVRYDARGEFDEVLSVDQDWSGFSGAPVLNAHRRDKLEDVLGSVLSATTVGREARAVLKLSRRADLDAIAQDIADGHLASVSVGYRVNAYRDEQRGQRRTKVATDWTPVEVSLVPIGADPNAKVRGLEMTEPNMNRAADNAAIRSIAELAGLDRAWADAQIDANATQDAARAAAFDEIKKRGGTVRTISNHDDRTMDDPANRAAAMGEALYARTDAKHQLSQQAREFAHRGIGELAEMALRAAGIQTTGLSKNTIVQRALHSTSDFPLAMSDTMNRTVQAAYAVPKSPLVGIAKQTSVRDFRPVTRVSTSQFSRLEKVNEAGEYKHGTFEEGGEKLSIATFGKMFALTRQALVNDDLGIFTGIGAKMGQSAAALVADNIAALWIANPKLSDGKAVWHADHGNVAATGGELSDETLNAARLAMRSQKDLAGYAISIEPKVLIVAPALETHAQKLLAAINPTSTSEVNVWSGSLTLMVEPRLTNPAAWYLADPANGDLESIFLEGETSPVVESRAGWDVDGVEFKIRLDHGCAFVDHRGLYKNAGAAK